MTGFIQADSIHMKNRAGMIEIKNSHTCHLSSYKTRRSRVQKWVSFQKGEAAHLEFPDESFEAVVSNFVIHEVRSEKDKRRVVQEALQQYGRICR